MPTEQHLIENGKSILRVNFETGSSRTRSYTSTNTFSPSTSKIIGTKEKVVGGSATATLQSDGRVAISVSGSYHTYNTTSTPVYGTITATSSNPSAFSQLSAGITSGGVNYTFTGSVSTVPISNTKVVTYSASGTYKSDSEDRDKAWAAARASLSAKLSSATLANYTQSVSVGPSVSLPYSKVSTSSMQFSGSDKGFTYTADITWKATGSYYVGTYKGVTSTNTSTDYYYKYEVDVELEVNTPPTLKLTSSNGTPITNSMKINHDTSKPYTFNLVVNDVDSGQTLSYKIVKDGVTLKDWTTTTSGSIVYYTTTAEALSTGSNAFTVYCKDSTDATTSISFSLRNIVPKSYCLEDVSTLIKTLGFTPTNAKSLNSLKPTGYSKTTLSLAEIINFF